MGFEKAEIRLAFAGNRRLIRELVCMAIKKENENVIDIVAEIEDLRMVPDLLHDVEIDILIVDIALAGVQALQSISHIKNFIPGIKILAVAPNLNRAEIQDFIKAGVRGYVSTMESSIADVINAVKAVIRGEFWIDRKMTADLLDEGLNPTTCALKNNRNKFDILTAREREILYFLSKGQSNKDIAFELSISDKTVKSHINNIFKKLNITRRIEAILFAIKHGIQRRHIQ